LVVGGRNKQGSSPEASTPRLLLCQHSEPGKAIRVCAEFAKDLLALGPAAGVVVGAQDLERGVGDAIGDDEGRFRDDELARAGHPAGVAELRISRKQFLDACRMCKATRLAAAGSSCAMWARSEWRSPTASGDQVIFMLLWERDALCASPMRRPIP